MRGMRHTRLPGSGRRKAGEGVDCMTKPQRELFDVIELFKGEFTLLDVAAKTGRSVQTYGTSIRALIRMGFVEQTYRSPSSREPSKYRVVKP